MATERTLSIIKPDAVAKNVIGQIYARFLTYERDCGELAAASSTLPPRLP